MYLSIYLHHLLSIITFNLSSSSPSLSLSPINFVFSYLSADLSVVSALSTCIIQAPITVRPPPLSPLAITESNHRLVQPQLVPHLATVAVSSHLEALSGAEIWQTYIHKHTYIHDMHVCLSASLSISVHLSRLSVSAAP